MTFLFRIYFMFKEITKKINEDNVSVYAAQSSFFIIVSLFPFLILLFNLIQYTPITKEWLTSFLINITPAQLNDLLSSTINEIYSRPSGALISISAITSLWVASKAFLGITQGLNSVFGIEETRNYIIRRIKASVYTLFFIVLIVLTLVFLVFGNRFLDFTETDFPIFYNITMDLLKHKFIIGQCVLTIIFMFMYKFVPNRKESLVRELPGALIAAIGWQLFSYIYSLYISFTPGFSIMYGSLATIVFAMLWLYFCMSIMFFGAEFNTFIEKKIIYIPFKKQK